MKIMETKISATEAARSLSDIINRVVYRGEEFIVERGGEAVCKITPVGPRGCTFAELVEFFKSAPKLDDEYLDILEEITRNQQPVPESPWSR
jgi:antitoxin (DNA-binding transcriptional repressor) of toxin-antitoxin stability system